jgi:hypothetical protein
LSELEFNGVEIARAYSGLGLQSRGPDDVSLFVRSRDGFVNTSSRHNFHALSTKILPEEKRQHAYLEKPE